MSTDDHHTTAPFMPPPMSPDGASLIVLSGAAKGRAARLPGGDGQSFIVGKSSTCDLVLADETVSRQHISITREVETLVVRDLESRNGVRIGGALVKEAVIEPGAILRIGDVELLVAVELEDVAIAPSARGQFGLAYGAGLEMRRIFGVLERIAPTDASVLLWGESGTGKDVLARSIHMHSKRSEGHFEVVDCGAVKGSLIESELFGHERGAFTGAVSTHIGAFERAAGGTIFLDEIGELAPELQPKLLRVLEAREFRRVGGTKMLPADVRVVAATTRNLAREIKRGGFREDLFFRLAVVSIQVPPLRSRTQDVPLLAQKLLEAAGGAQELDRASLNALAAYDWPGNVRELRNVLERAVHLSPPDAPLKLMGFPRARDEAQDDGDTEGQQRLVRREPQLPRASRACRSEVRATVRALGARAARRKRGCRRARHAHGSDGQGVAGVSRVRASAEAVTAARSKELRGERARPGGAQASARAAGAR